MEEGWLRKCAPAWIPGSRAGGDIAETPAPIVSIQGVYRLCGLLGVLAARRIDEIDVEIPILVAVKERHPAAIDLEDPVLLRRAAAVRKIDSRALRDIDETRVLRDSPLTDTREEGEAEEKTGRQTGSVDKRPLERHL